MQWLRDGDEALELLERVLRQVDLVPGVYLARRGGLPRRWCRIAPVSTWDAIGVRWFRQPRLGHNLTVKSKVHPKYKTKYHVGNRPEYERALVRRGDLTLWLSADAMDAWRAAPSGRPGGPRKFSDLSIKTALTLRLVFIAVAPDGGLPAVRAVGNAGRSRRPGPHHALAAKFAPRPRTRSHPAPRTASSHRR